MATNYQSQPIPGEEVDVKLTLFNAGDRPVKDGKLQAFIDGRKVAETDYKGVSPFRGKLVPMKVKLPMNWNKDSSLKMTVKAPTEGDADPHNNALDFFILKATDKKITETSHPVKIDPSKIDTDLITDATPGTAKKPLQQTLKSGQHWYRLEEGSGTLQIELVGDSAERVNQIMLFDQTGKQVRSTPVKGPFYLKVDAPKSADNKTKINIWWE